MTEELGADHQKEHADNPLEVVLAAEESPESIPDMIQSENE